MLIQSRTFELSYFGLPTNMELEVARRMIVDKVSCSSDEIGDIIKDVRPSPLELGVLVECSSNRGTEESKRN
jgi:hypothetical protein